MTILKNIFARFKKQPEPTALKPTEISQIDPLSLRLHEWRRNQVLLNKALLALRLQTVRAMLQVLKNESPANIALQTLHSRVEDRAALQAKIEGFHLAINMLESMDKPIVDKQPIPATFEQPEGELNHARR